MVECGVKKAVQGGFNSDGEFGGKETLSFRNSNSTWPSFQHLMLERQGTEPVPRMQAWCLLVPIHPASSYVAFKTDSSEVCELSDPLYQISFLLKWSRTVSVVYTSHLQLVQYIKQWYNYFYY